MDSAFSHAPQNLQSCPTSGHQPIPGGPSPSFPSPSLTPFQIYSPHLRQQQQLLQQFNALPSSWPSAMPFPAPFFVPLPTFSNFFSSLASSPFLAPQMITPSPPFPAPVASAFGPRSTAAAESAAPTTANEDAERPQKRARLSSSSSFTATGLTPTAPSLPAAALPFRPFWPYYCGPQGFAGIPTFPHQPIPMTFPAIAYFSNPSSAGAMGHPPPSLRSAPPGFVFNRPSTMRPGPISRYPTSSTSAQRPTATTSNRNEHQRQDPPTRTDSHPLYYFYHPYWAPAQFPMAYLPCLEDERLAQQLQDEEYRLAGVGPEMGQHILEYEVLGRHQARSPALSSANSNNDSDGADDSDSEEEDSLPHRDGSVSPSFSTFSSASSAQRALAALGSTLEQVMERLLRQECVEMEGLSMEQLEELAPAQTLDMTDIHKGLVSHDDTCVICLMGYENGEAIRVLPCNHPYHKECIDKWLSESAVCPICKRTVSRSQGSSSSSFSSMPPVSSAPASRPSFSEDQTTTSSSSTATATATATTFPPIPTDLRLPDMEPKREG